MSHRTPAKFNTCTVYVDVKECMRHTVVCEVDTDSGIHTVTHSNVGTVPYGETPASIRKSAEFYFGAPYVRVYIITEVR